MNARALPRLSIVLLSITTFKYLHTDQGIKTNVGMGGPQKIHDPLKRTKSEAKVNMGPKEPSRTIVDLKKRRFHGDKPDKDAVAQPGAKKTFSTMNYEELKIAKNEYVASGNLPTAIKFLERMLKLCDDVNEQADIILELGDLFLETGKRIQAETMYTEFALLFPGNPKTEYADFRSISCGFDQTLDPERDQSKTKEVLERTQKFLKREIYIEYKDKVEGIQKECYKKLALSEFDRCRFYFNQLNVYSVETRLKEVRTEYLPHVPELEEQLVLLENQLKEMQGTLEKPKLPKEATVVAQQEEKEEKTDFVSRF